MRITSKLNFRSQPALTPQLYARAQSEKILTSDLLGYYQKHHEVDVQQKIAFLTLQA